MPGRKALLLLSNGNSTKVNGSFDCVTQQLTEAGVAYTVFRKIMENPRKEVVMEGAAFAREQGCDFILALGGGAVLDASKAIAAMAVNEGKIADYNGKEITGKLPGIVTILLRREPVRKLRNLPLLQIRKTISRCF